MTKYFFIRHTMLIIQFNANNMSMKKIHIKRVKYILVFCALMSALHIFAATGTWKSTVTGGLINYKTTESSKPRKDVNSKYMTVVYLENLSFEKIGGNTIETDVNWLLNQGYRVIELDYSSNANAVSPQINTDIAAINDAIAAGSFCSLTDCSTYRSYVLCEGYRIMQDVSYFLNDPAIYNYPSSYLTRDSMYMDIVYPANPSKPIPVALSFSYSNSWATANYNQRLNLAYTLSGFDDTFLEGAPARGIAWAIADHPKFCDWGQGKPIGGANKAYGSFEVNPDAAQKVKSAVRTLRSKAKQLGLSDNIGIYGFSRGSDAGSMAIGDKSVPEFENAGFHNGENDDVQVAALGSGVFDFTQIFNATGDGDSNLETRCTMVWGPLAANMDLWKSMGSEYLVETNKTAPVIFFYNTTDALYYQDQIAHLKSKLETLGVPTEQTIDYSSGHAVPGTPASLNAVYNFFDKYLYPSNTTGVDGNTSSISSDLEFQFVGQKEDKLKLNFQLNGTGNLKVSLYNITGVKVNEKNCKVNTPGDFTVFFDQSKNKLRQGIYFIHASMENRQGFKKLRID